MCPSAGFEPVFPKGKPSLDLMCFDLMAENNMTKNCDNNNKVEDTLVALATMNYTTKPMSTTVNMTF